MFVPRKPNPQKAMAELKAIQRHCLRCHRSGHPADPIPAACHPEQVRRQQQQHAPATQPSTHAGTLPHEQLDPALAVQKQQQQQPQQQPQEQQRSKKQAKKKRGAENNEYVPITEGLTEHVRRIRVDPKKDALAEDKHLVTLSKVGKAPQLQLSEDRLSVTGYKGFRSVRGNHGVHVGTWYCEARITHAGATGHVRLGWCTNKAELQAPVGFDAHGYCYRDLEGSRVHQGLREPYGASYGEGDVVGLFLHMPEGGHPIEVQSQDVVRFKGSLYYVNEPEPTPKTLLGSVIAFSKNGESQGPAYIDIPEGTYYPAASLYTMPEQTEGVTVAFNFGPHFAYPPLKMDGLPAARAWCELAAPPPAPAPAPAAMEQQ